MSRGNYVDNSIEKVSRVGELLADNGYSIRQFCMACGISTATYHKWKNGLAQISKYNWERVVQALDCCNREYLDFGEGESLKTGRKFRIDGLNDSPRVIIQQENSLHGDGSSYNSDALIETVNNLVESNKEILSQNKSMLELVSKMLDLLRK